MKNANVNKTNAKVSSVSKIKLTEKQKIEMQKRLDNLNESDYKEKTINNGQIYNKDAVLKKFKVETVKQARTKIRTESKNLSAKLLTQHNIFITIGNNEQKLIESVQNLYNFYSEILLDIKNFTNRDKDKHAGIFEAHSLMLNEYFTVIELK